MRTGGGTAGQNAVLRHRGIRQEPTGKENPRAARMGLAQRREKWYG